MWHRSNYYQMLSLTSRKKWHEKVVVISPKSFVPGQKYSRIVLRTGVGPFGVSMNKI